jgi:hypothetical protein
MALAGALFVAYPAARPFSDETSLEGARAFASTSWVAAHGLAMVAFALLAIGLFGAYLALRDTAGARPALAAALLGWVGGSLTLPYYGAETFGLRAIGAEAARRGDVTLVALGDAVRFGPGIVFIVAGLLLLATASVALAVALWRSDRRPRWAGVPLAVGLALYLPQFPTPQAVRVAHGVLVGAGCLLVAWVLGRVTRVVDTATTPEP